MFVAHSSGRRAHSGFVRFESPPWLEASRLPAVSAWALLLVASPIEIGAWDVPADCSSKAAFIEKVEAEAEAEASSHADEPPVMEADVTVEEVAAAHWRLQLRLRRDGRDDTRAFDATSCAAVVEAAAVVVALRLVQWRENESPALEEPLGLPDPEVRPSLIQPPDPPPALPRTTPPATIPPEVPPASPKERVSQLGGWVGVHQGLALGVAPGVGGGFALDGGVTGRWWRAGIAVQAVPRRIQTHPGDPGIRGRFDLVTGESFGCGVPKVGPVEFPVCGRFAVTGVHAVGEGSVRSSDRVWGTWLGAGGSVGIAWYATERIAPALSAVALAPLEDWAFSVGGVPGALHQTGPVAFRAWLGLEIHW